MTSKRSEEENNTNTTAVADAVDDADDDISAEFEEEKEAEGDISSGNFNLEEMERTEGDHLVADHPSEETMVGNTGNGSGQLKETPEDERDYMKDTRDVHEEKTQDDAHQNNIEEAADEKNAPCVRQDMQQKIQETTVISQKGTIAEIPEQEQEQENIINVAHGHGQEVPEVIDNDDDDESVVAPGFMFIAGPDYTGEGIHTGYESGDVKDDTNIEMREASCYRDFYQKMIRHVEVEVLDLMLRV